MVATVPLMLSAVPKPAGPVDLTPPGGLEPVNPLDAHGLSDPDCGLDGASSGEYAEPPLTSEPPLADSAPLTSEPPLATEPPLTSEPTVTGMGTEPLEV
ncbi:hypothetical protein [Streptomyces sp. TP-A0874]|uniref:hypothetical protein n=1 Tax=Streptomyces sp. TP-A0874 TaxID=549819 RepID=UPI0009A06EA3|nr:hypothetical protein [Streptomyces sp. TP-A0874]